MSSPSTGSGRKRTTVRQTSAEDQALNQIAKEAEARLAARRAARAEAREIRMKVLEKEQKENEEREKHEGSVSRTGYPSSVGSSRRGSDDSSSTGGDENLREIKKELAELEEKYRKAMVNNAQLDNEKQSARYQVDLLKDTLEEMEEQLLEVTREHKDRCRDLEQKKRDYNDLRDELEFYKQQLEQRDKLIQEYGLVFISNEAVDESGEKDKKKKKKKKKKSSEGGATTESAALVTPQAADILKKVEGNLDERLKAFEVEKTALQEEVKSLRQQLEDEKEKNALAEKYASPKHDKSSKINGPTDMEILEIQMEAQKQLNESKFKLKKAEQDITTLEGTVIRLESQVKRYKHAAENSEKVEDELKGEKRKLQRELREAQTQVEEVTTQNQHLQKRLDKLKSSRNALLKA